MSNAARRGCLEMKENKNILQYDPQVYNLALAEALKKVPEFEAPEWSRFVKSGQSKERPIEEPAFWFRPAASILRQIYKNKTVGVQRFRTRYGSKKDRGMQPEIFKRASGKIIRVILQQSDKAGFTEVFKGKKERSGRKLTAKGKEFLEGIKISEKVEKKERVKVEEIVEKKPKINEILKEENIEEIKEEVNEDGN